MILASTSSPAFERSRQWADTLRGWLGEAEQVELFTKADDLPYERIPQDPITRQSRLRALSDAQGAAHRASKVGRRERVLVEDADGRGYSDDYTPFRVTGGVRGRLAEVLGVLAAGDAVIATLCS